jgi:hypothetical protein
MFVRLTTTEKLSTLCFDTMFFEKFEEFRLISVLSVAGRGENFEAGISGKFMLELDQRTFLLIND